MGRLRNLSESFKGMAFHHSSNSESSPSVTKTDSSPQNADLTSTKETPAIARETSGSSIPQANPPTSRYEQRSVSRPTSMIYTPPSMAVGTDTHIEELMPVFSFLSSHNNKLYQEGYFLKLNDLDTNGKPNADRNWTECFAQLVGTVLSLWDAAALDAAGQDGEVAPTFINLADASIKMIQTLPTRNQDVQPLQNVLSVSTAGKNRYLLHFNSLHSLTQWTASIRLSMFEHGSLQELYTGSLIAGKGKHLNNIRMIMERTKHRHEDWARVRFGAGTPWRRCWCVIEPPDEKEWQRAAKTMKKRSAYDRPAYPKGDIKFYDTKKTKKATPIATITDAYSAYAIWPQSKPLIDQSTLVKVEGRITIHSTPESKTEGFVFVMPEVHPAVSGFEMMLRWLFPVYDCFHLYGRPNRLIADTLDARGLMFAMPKEKRYGYLEIIDVAALIHTEGSEKWSEREWRKQMKELTSRRMITSQNRPSNVGSTRPRNSTGSRHGVRYDDGGSIKSTPSTHQGHNHNVSTDAVFAIQPKRAVTGPPNGLASATYHNRSVSESVALSSPSKGRRQTSQYKPSRLSMDRESPEEMDAVPPPPVHRNLKPGGPNNTDLSDSRNSSDSELAIQRTRSHAEEVGRDMGQQAPPGPVAAPPGFSHQPGELPQRQPDQRPEMRRNKSRLSNATLEQMADAGKAGTTGTAGAAAAAAWRNGSQSNDQAPRGVNQSPNDNGMTANQDASKAMVAGNLRPQADVRHSETSEPSEPRPPYSTERSSSQHSIKRKPIPGLAPPMPSSSSERGRSPGQTSNYSGRRDSLPDYASGQKTADATPEKSLPQARTGVLRTVGNPNLSSDAPPVPPKSDIPEIDFGVTQSLTPGHSRPGTAMGSQGRGSPLEGFGRTTPERSSPRTPGLRTPEAATPDDSKRSSYFGKAGAALGHSRNSSMAWQPPKHLGQQSPGPALSPEDFVQQRYAAASRPSGYVPQRSVSESTVERIAMVTAPKKLQKKRDARPSSRNSLLNQDYSSNLTAREQEHVARMTGGPLVNMNERSRTPDPSVGLIGAIEAREQEKRNIKQGVSGHMVQAAIAQRQQHASGQQFHAQQAAERAYAQNYGAYAQSQLSYPSPGYGQQQWASRSQPQLSPQYTSWGMPVPQQPTSAAPPVGGQLYQQAYQQTSYQGQQQQWYPQASGQGHENNIQHQQMRQQYGGFYQG